MTKQNKLLAILIIVFLAVSVYLSREATFHKIESEVLNFGLTALNTTKQTKGGTRWLGAEEILNYKEQLSHTAELYQINVSMQNKKDTLMIDCQAEDFVSMMAFLYHLDALRDFTVALFTLKPTRDGLIKMQIEIRPYVIF